MVQKTIGCEAADVQRRKQVGRFNGGRDEAVRNGAASRKRASSHHGFMV
tara:strand:+ start:473 stop:619 length:147 start_codon:yes stop_codon:yes gene_type:complete